MTVFEELAPPVDTLANDLAEDSATATPLSAVVPDEFCSGGDSLRSLYQQLRAILDGPQADEDGILQPTGYALRAGISVLEQTAYALMSEKRCMPPGCLTTDEFGGMRVEWWSGHDCVVILAIGASDERPSYVFSRIGQSDQGLTEQRVLPYRLAERLKKLTELRES